MTDHNAQNGSSNCAIPLKENKDYHRYTADLKKFRRDLHMIPELDRDLPKTISYVRSILEKTGCTITPVCGGSGLCAFFDFGKDQTIAFRTDMDGLPVCERNQVDYRSRQEGKMHACGHDGHMAMVLVLAEYLGDLKNTAPDSDEIKNAPDDSESMKATASVPEGMKKATPDPEAVKKTTPDPEAMKKTTPCPDGLKKTVLDPEDMLYNVMLIFQPSEETQGGAKEIAESGILQEHNTAAIFGIHMWPFIPAGHLGGRPGIQMPKSSEINLYIHGKSAHATNPEEGLNALLAGAKYVKELYDAHDLSQQDVKTPEDRTIACIGLFESGTARNVIAGECHLKGTIRAFTLDHFDQVLGIVEGTADKILPSTGCTYEVTHSEGYDPVYNDPELFRKAMPAAEAALRCAFGGKQSEGSGSVSRSGGGKTSGDEERTDKVSIDKESVDKESVDKAGVDKELGGMECPGTGDNICGIPEFDLFEKPLMISEDFSFYSLAAPSVLLLLGTGTGISLHSDEFDFDEKVLETGFHLYRQMLQTPGLSR